MDECTFCQIIAGRRESHMLYEDDETAAFLDANPAAQGHTLVVPKSHRKRLFTGVEPAPVSIFETVNHVSTAIGRALNTDGFSLFYTAGPLVGSVSHAHVHIVPRYEDDKIQLGLERGSLDEKVASQLVDRVRKYL